ncbi:MULTISPECIES: LPXTG cell wall anchor domain-containing protein [unclassified Pseudoclavibacter]|uniref:LPXTG cell wall anchor domain-containing protein n=1 Tax=unclassified Pseudoclavibacter TaxID=2615177 RepID=UPI000CE7F602|nr:MULTISPECIES: LPXTG cell wall anchor domain-containing protein [unclassified Pseudoclavibacter]PPF39790.1 hypothetical protein C5E05_00815 [Pseudoclavibacter sp. AY1H1]PPF76135.1 hypothetical protein C5B99_09815 [Pseudoclavibacter sp. Z016]
MKKLAALLCASTAALMFSVALIPALPAYAFNEFDVGPELVSAELVTPTTVGGGDEIRINWSVRHPRGIASSAISLETGTGSSTLERKTCGQFDPVVGVRDGDIVSGTTTCTTGGTEWATGEWRVESLGFFDEWGVFGYAAEEDPIISALPKLQIEVGTDGDQQDPELVALEVVAPDEVRQSDVIRFNWTVRESSRVTDFSLLIVDPNGGRYQASGFDRNATTRDGDLVSGSLHLTVKNSTWALGEYRVYSFYAGDEHENYSPTATSADNEVLASAATFTVVDVGGPDVTAPELLSAGFVQSTVRMGDGPELLNWTIRDQSDIDEATFYLEIGRGKIYTLGGSSNKRLGDVVSGDSGDDLWVPPVEAEEPFWGEGEFKVVGALLRDEFGNTTTLTADHPIIAGLPPLTILPKKAPIPPRTPSPTVTAPPSVTPTPVPTPTPTSSSPTGPTAPPTGTPTPTEPVKPTATATAPPTASPPPVEPVATQSPAPVETAATQTPAPTTPAVPTAPSSQPTGSSSTETDQAVLASTGAENLWPILLGAAGIVVLGAALISSKRRGHRES